MTDRPTTIAGNEPAEERIGVLLVEDDKESGSSIKRMLERRGAKVILVPDTRQALAAFHDNQLDVVVADIRLGGESGVELLRLIRGEDRDFPVVLLTGYDSVDSAIQAVRLGAQDYILKPLTRIEDLLQPVRRAVRSHRLQTANRALEQKLRASEKRFRSLFEGMSDAIFVVDSETRRIVDCNRQAAVLTGLPREEILAMRVEDLHPPAARAEGIGQFKAMTGIATHMFETAILTRDRGVIAVSATSALLELEGRSHVVESFRDISERRKMEEALRSSREMLRRLSARQQAVREEERKRVARQIHDSLGHHLTAMKMMVTAAAAAAGAGGIESRFEAVQTLLDEAIETVRTIATELRPGVLDHLGLPAAIEWQAQEFEARSGIACDVVVPAEEMELDGDVATGVFRILQEVLTNVARHARAAAVNVSLDRDGDAVVLRVRDEGRGITPAEIADARSLGLLGMRERAQSLGGEFEISGEPGRGTTVTVRVPALPAGATMRG